MYTENDATRKINFWKNRKFKKKEPFFLIWVLILWRTFVLILVFF